MDPFELRYKNLYNETSASRRRPGRSPTCCLTSLFDMLRPKYEEAKKRCKELSTPEKKRGVGIALGIYGCGLDGPDGSEAARAN
jgi:aldehyde oxidoreductase